MIGNYYSGSAKMLKLPTIASGAAPSLTQEAAMVINSQGKFKGFNALTTEGARPYYGGGGKAIGRGANDNRSPDMRLLQDALANPKAKAAFDKAWGKLSPAEQAKIADKMGWAE